ncbi:MAG: RhuM family protein [Rickettsia hoogstraalii]
MLRKSSCCIFCNSSNKRKKECRKQIEYYNLDAIISVGYRVNSKRGNAFRKWATNLLKEYLIKV